MQNLEEVTITEITQEENYLLVQEEYERMGGGDILLYKGSGKELVEKLKEIYSLDEEDIENYGGRSVLEIVDDFNGDGWDYVQVYKL